MVYEKPNMIDLSNRPEKGFGSYGCNTGSGALTCGTGPTAEQACDEGNTFTAGPKYED